LKAENLLDGHGRESVGDVITAVGIDTQSIDEVAASLKEFGVRYTRRLFTRLEIEDCNESPVTAACRYAERFAAKEAVFKLLDVREVIPSWRDIETRMVNGRPEIVLLGVAAELASQQNIAAISLGISHDARVAIAIAMGYGASRAPSKISLG
jgi:holo-[acyl-carrier protein] synthase